jgi:hypothetical protein
MRPVSWAKAKCAAVAATAREKKNLFFIGTSKVTGSLKVASGSRAGKRPDPEDGQETET